MNIVKDNEMNFVFKINKITYLLNHVDVYYQKEILKDIKNYNIQINNNFKNFSDQNERKNKIYYYLNKYLDNIINDQLDYLIETYHKNKKNQIILDADKNAARSININNKESLNNSIDKSVHNIKNNLNNNISINNDDFNNLINNKINNFFDKIKVDLFQHAQNLVDNKIENNLNLNTNNYIQKKIKDFLKIFLKDDKIYNDIVDQMNNEINSLYSKLEEFKKNQSDLEIIIEKYILSNENKINKLENNIIDKINNNLESKVKVLVEIFNNTIKNTVSNSNNSCTNINENQIIRNIENKILSNNNFSKNNFEIKFNKENSEIELYYFNDLISSTKLNIKGLIGPKGPQGIRGDPGDITIIRNIKINDDDTIKFTMQNGTSVYDINTDNKLPKGPQGEKGNIGEKGDPGEVNINLKWDQENVMKINKENSNNITFLKSLSIGENSHCIKDKSLSIGNAICYKDNSLALGNNSKSMNENSIAFFGNTIGKNSFSYYANDVEENCVKFGSKESNKFNIENISLKAKEIILDCDDLILKDNNFKNKKILELEEKINILFKEINDLKK